MDQGRFDSLTRSLATTKTRRGLLGGLAALVVGARAASATVSPCPYPGQTLNRKGQCTCPPGQTDVCPGSGCTNRKTDPFNCGSCGNDCGLGETCRKGECREAACTPNYQYCTEGVTVCCNEGLGGCHLRTDCGPGQNEDGICC